MRIALEEVGRRGQIDLVFSLQNERTIVRHSYCEVPFKITRLLNSSAVQAQLMLMHCTAGIFGGDELECSIRVERGASVRITQQSATKIHPSEGRLAKLSNRILVESGAELQFFLEPVIPFAESSMAQTTLIDVQPGGRLLFWDALMAGRVGRGERWRFSEFDSETCLYLNHSLRYLDRFKLPTGLEASPWVLGDCNYLGTGLYVGPCARDFASVLRESMPQPGINTLTPDFTVIRVASVSGPDFHCHREKFIAGIDSCAPSR